MFEQFGDLFQIPVEINNERHRVTIRFSIAQRVAREGYNPGELPHGKHARGNIGVSVVRADRELELQIGWCNQYDPRERWWGVEVDFPPALDETFGVTNNKQSARLLAEFATISAEQIAEREGYSSVPEMRESWVADGDTRIVLLDVKQVIESNLSTIRATIKQQSEGKKGNKRHLQPDSAEVIGTKATEVRKREGHSGASDRDEGLPANERQRIIAQDLEDQGLAAEEAEEKANVLVGDGRKYEFYKANLESSEFFTVRRKGGALLIGLNVNHPAYNKLVTILEHGDESGDVDTLKGRLHRSYEGLKLLLEAWARYEDEQTDGLPRERVQDARRDWGRMARLFFRED